MRMRATISAAVALAMFLGVSAHADSDGYFCAGDGYLAYELRWTKDGPDHILQVIQFGPEIGILKSNPVKLEDFQTHGMACETDFVRLSGYSRHYFVDISDRDQPKVLLREPSGAFTSRSQEANLGHWSKEGVLDLTVAGTVGRFQLVIAKVSHQVPEGLEHYTITELIERGNRQEILRRVRLFSGIFLETAD